MALGVITSIGEDYFKLKISAKSLGYVATSGSVKVRYPLYSLDRSPEVGMLVDVERFWDGTTNRTMTEKLTVTEELDEKPYYKRIIILND